MVSGLHVGAGRGNVALGTLLYAPAFFDDFEVSAARNAGPAPPAPARLETKQTLLPFLVSSPSPISQYFCECLGQQLECSSR